MTQQSIHTLLVTSDQKWQTPLYGHLRRNGFTPLSVEATGDAALDSFCQSLPRLVLIDQHLADDNIVDLCRTLLTMQPTVKLVLAVENDDQLPLAALHVGVSGCLNRNSSPAEWVGMLTYVMKGGMAFNHNVIETLLAQTWAVQKRDTLMKVGALQINLAHRLVTVAGQRVQLTPREFTLLACLARNVDRVVTFDQLLNDAWGYHTNDGTPAQVRLYIARLRNKLTVGKKVPAFILTERGIGYRLYSGALRRVNAQLCHVV